MVKINLQTLERIGLQIHDEPIKTVKMLEHETWINGEVGCYYPCSDGSHVFIPHDIRNKIIDELNSIENS